MAEAERAPETKQDAESSDEVLFRDDPAESGRRDRAEGFRLHDSGEDAHAELTFSDASPEVQDDAELDPDTAHDSGVALLDASPDADPDSGRFTVAPAAPAALPPRPQVNKRAAEFYADGVETHAPPPPPQARGPAQAGFAICPGCEAKNPPEAARCGRCGEPLPDAIPAATRGPIAPGMAIKVRAAREASGPLDDAVLPPHARIVIQARRAEAAEARQASQTRWVARRRGLMLRIGGVFLVLGLLPSLFLVSGWVWWLGLVADLAIGAGVAKFLVDRDANTVTGQLGFAAGTVLSTLLKGGVGAAVHGMSLLFLFSACFLSLFLAVVIGGFVGHALQQSALDEA